MLKNLFLKCPAFFVESPAFSEKMSCFYNNPSGNPSFCTVLKSSNQCDCTVLKHSNCDHNMVDTMSGEEGQN
jgi:hypothetical protein